MQQREISARHQQLTRMGIDENASKVRFGWSDEGVITSIRRGDRD